MMTMNEAAFRAQRPLSMWLQGLLRSGSCHPSGGRERQVTPCIADIGLVRPSSATELADAQSRV